jgi:glyoxalase family protein
VEVKADAEAPRGTGGVGGVHHVAWRVPDSETELALRRVIVDVGLQPSPQIDRFWFQSVYFREPSGILFELATDGPGFDRDEAAEHLGETLILPPWLEPKRAAIEAALPPLVLPTEAS